MIALLDMCEKLLCGRDKFNDGNDLEIKYNIQQNATDITKTKKASRDRICTFRPTRRKESFIVLKQVSKPNLHENFSKDTPGRSALKEGIKRSNEGRFESAKYFYEIAATHGEVIAVHNLATMYLHGQGTPKDLETARTYFIKCAAEGYPLSMSQLGYIYLYGRGVEVDYRKAREWFLRASNAGDEPYAQFLLAVIFINGYGVAVDIPRGMSWLYKSARNKFIPAIYNLGVFAENGENGMRADWNDALICYEEAVRFGPDDYAMNNLATLYCKVGKKQSRAVELFQKAAENGLSQAVFNLGEAHMNGIGVPVDPVEAAKFYYKAAKLAPNSAAEYALAEIFYHGVVHRIKPNIAVSKYWLQISSAHGHMKARRSLMMLNQSNKGRERAQMESI